MTSTTPGTADDLLGSDLGFSLGVVFRHYLRTADSLLDQLPGGPRGYHVLAAAAQEDPSSQGALALRLGIDKTVMTYLVDDLEKAGLVERRTHLADRRNKQIVATPAGRTAWTDTQLRLARAEDHLLAPLKPADREVFRALLCALAAHANAADPVHDACQLVTELS